MAATAPRRIWAANRLGLDYRAEAARLGAPPVPILDVHTHISGERASHVYREVCDLYGISWTWSQTRLTGAGAVKAALGDRVDFIAVPDWSSADRHHAFTHGFLEGLDRWHSEFGARCVKLWAAPRLWDFVEGERAHGVVPLDSPWRVRVAEKAVSLGMMLMAHVADPDTWFATKYADASKYGTKLAQYAPLERMLERFRVPWMVAHMGGWPENLEFLDGLLERHDNLVLDTSATKWMVRELSRHPRDRLIEFLSRWRGRILFGSDIVTTDEHLSPAKSGVNPMAEQASSEAEAFELYASRYWALRTMWERDWSGESPIADPDLALVDPSNHDAMSAPRLEGKSLPPDLLRDLYDAAARRTILAWVRGEPQR